MSQNSENVLVAAKNIRKFFPVRHALFSTIQSSKRFVHAVDGVNLDVVRGEVLSLVGESGCGKTTLARLILRLLDPTEGTIIFDGQDLLGAAKADMQKLRIQMQAIFQDPYASLDPKKTIFQTVAEPLIVNNLQGKVNVRERVRESLIAVGLTPPALFSSKFPFELSGGQRQRVAIARAIVITPRLIVADEPVSMLDVSIRAEILTLMLELRRKYQLTYIFITHDLAVARYISDRMAVMYLGKVVEIGPAEAVCKNPAHPYTKALLAALPSSDPRDRQKDIPIKGEVPNAIEIPLGCRFRSRCPYAFEKCTSEPELQRVGSNHFAACYLGRAES